ncbi:MAG: hypothetical protein FJ070_07560 [Cyanobacteria bacterium K_DeepCast_150m_m2_101]|jgi:hypothetical protein|nr:hypothetical protein [Cyanobacteria bacterium K_DeepCast_150m_m2_101]
MTAPVPWSLAWSEDGELAPQDRFDLLQSLVASECESAQPSLVVAVERLSVEQLTVLSCELSTEGLTGLCA